MAGSQQDAILIVELSKWGAMLGVNEASRVIFSEDFNPDDLADNGPHVRTMLTFAETVAILVKNGLLDRELVNDWLSFPAIWQRVGPAALRAREMGGLAALYEGTELLARAATSESAT